jgi:hypothetical protein
VAITPEVEKEDVERTQRFVFKVVEELGEIVEESGPGVPAVRGVIGLLKSRDLDSTLTGLFCRHTAWSAADGRDKRIGLFRL